MCSDQDLVPTHAPPTPGRCCRRLHSAGDCSSYALPLLAILPQLLPAPLPLPQHLALPAILQDTRMPAPLRTACQAASLHRG